MDIDFVRERLIARPSDASRTASLRHAAVAVVLRDGERSAEVLLIERAHREGDPWSGQMAFPGGRAESGDISTRGTARRETFEEVGLELSEAEHLGQIDELVGNARMTPPLVVAAHAFHLATDQELDLCVEEVQTAFWFPLVDMLDESRRIDYVFPKNPGTRYPGIVVGLPERHIVWGLTYRVLGTLFDALGRPLSTRSSTG
jgi:8-oxo-dGTP pyrophosphatase MutT (NUDIX family)